MAATRFYLDRRSKAKDGKGNVIITIFHNHSTSSVPTGVRVTPKEWNGSKVIKHPGADALNAKLSDRMAKVNKLIALLSLEEDFNSMKATDIRAAILEENVGKKKGHPIKDVFKEYLNKDLSDGTKHIYDVLLKKVISFAGENVMIEDINLKWITSFDQYLAQVQKANGKAIYLRHLKAICNHAKKTGMIHDNPFDLFKIKHEPTIKRSAELEKFREFLTYPTNPVNAKYRDYFLLIFLLIGINVKDLLLAKKSQVINGRLEYIRSKTHKKYSIKIEPEAQALIDKYSGKTYLLEAMEHCQHYTSFARAINKFCRKIGPKVLVPRQDCLLELEERIDPIIPDVETYTARHSWATFAYEAGVSMDIVAQAMGHSSGHPTTLIYIKPNPSKTDEANRTVIDYVLSGLSVSSSRL